MPLAKLDPATALLNTPSVAVDLARALKYSTFGVAPDLDINDPTVAIGLLRATAASGAIIGVPPDQIRAIMGRSLSETKLVVQTAASLTIGTADPVPVIGWGQAAKALGISARTLARRRADVGDTSEPWWPDTDACRAWFAHLLAPTPLPPRSPKPAARPVGDPPRRPAVAPEGLSAADLRDRWTRR